MIFVKIFCFWQSFKILVLSVYIISKKATKLKSTVLLDFYSLQQAIQKILFLKITDIRDRFKSRPDTRPSDASPSSSPSSPPSLPPPHCLSSLPIPSPRHPLPLAILKVEKKTRFRAFGKKQVMDGPTDGWMGGRKDGRTTFWAADPIGDDAL